MWILYDFFSVLFFSVANTIDKYYVSKKYKSIYSFAVTINIVYLIFFGTVGYFIRNSLTFSHGLYWTIVASMVYFVMWIFWWKALTTGEASRVIAIFFTNPLFSAILAVIFLKESITGLKWLAILLIVVGAILSTLEKKKVKSKFNQAYLFALLASVFASAGNILSKQAMAYWPALTVQVVGYLVALPLYLLFLINKQVLVETIKTFSNLRSFSFIFLRGFIGFLAICAFQLAVGAGPVSLVVALNGGQPLMILIISTILSFVAPKIIKEEITKQALITKTAAVILIIAGAVIISLF